ncbi:BLUF domain-containing protein [Naasia lichenicola]|uniref:BLUF domain-containing protein n=1 Tax=Naasia lichenicola TaxID=2565933 RepID=UPI00130D7CA5|nr:BLUF domain-containing protein [Naasia lichenicola]
MLSSVYVSTATVPFSDEDLVELLSDARATNAELGVTGLLLHHDGQFMQALEGPEPAVRSLLKTIADDPRHKSVWVLWESPIEDRTFGDWSMGFRSVSDESLRDIPGFADFFEDGNAADRAWATPTRATWLLNWFRDNTL